MDKLNYPHLFSQPKIDNYEDLQKEYMKHAQIKDYYKNIDYSTPIKEIEPLAPLDSNFFSKNISLSDTKQQPLQYMNNYSREKELEKERNRQKQLEYQNFLNQQIEDKKRRKQQEEASRRQEELKYEQKFNMQLHQNQMRYSNGANNKLNKETKMEAMKELINDHPNLEGILKKINLPNAQSNITNDLIKSNNMLPNNERLNVSNQLYNNINDYNDINVNKSYYTNPNINQQFPRDNNTNNDYSMYYNNEHNNNNNNIHQSRTQQQQYIQSPHRMNYSSPNVLNDIAQAQQMNNINMGGIPLTNVSMSNNNICRMSNNMMEQQPHQSQYNRPTTPIYNANPSNNCGIPSVAMSSPNVNISAMMNNVNNGFNNNVSSTNAYYQPVQHPQMNNPYQYPQILDKMLDFVLQEQVKIINDYKETIEQLKNERDQAIYLNRANEEKIQALQRIQDKQAMIENKFGYSPFDQQYQDTLEEKLNHMMERSDVNMNMKKNNSNNDIDYNGQHPGINYKSKYEERFEQTADNFKGSLMGSTKFVKQTGQKKLLETWINDDEVNMNLDEEFKYHNNNNNGVKYNNNNKFHSNQNNYHNVNNVQHTSLHTNVNINDISEIIKKDNKSDSGDDDVNNNYIQDLNINKSVQQELKPKQNINVNKNKIMLNKDNNVDNYNHNIDDNNDNVNIEEHKHSIIHHDIKVNDNNGKSDNFIIENNNNENQFNIEQQDQSDKDDDLCIISKHSLNRSDNKQKDNGYITSSDDGDGDEENKHNESIKGELIINNNNNNVTHTKDNEEQIPEVIDNQQLDINEVKNDAKHINVNRSNMIMGEFNNVHNNSNFYGPIRLSNNSEHKNEDDEEDIPIEIETENDNTEDHYQIPSHNQSDNGNNNNTYKSNNESTINSRIILLPREQIHTDSIRRNPFTFANTLKQKLNQNESNLNNTNNNNNTILPTNDNNNNNNNSNLHNISTIKNNNNNDIFLDEDDIEEEAPHFHNPKEQSQIISQNDPQNDLLQQSQNKSNAELLKRMTYFDDDDSGTLEPSSKLIKSNARFSNKVRYPRGVTSKDINNLNSIFDKFKKKKQDQRTSQDDYEQSLNSFSKLNGTIDKNNSFTNDNNNGSLMNESLNTFNNNLNENNYFNFKEDDKILQKVNKLTKVAIDEIGQSQLSVFKTPK